jgi:hypothetical protein
MVLGRRMQRRFVIAGLAATFVAPVAVIQPASAAVLFSCDSVTGSAVLAPGLMHDKRPQSLSAGPTAPAGPQGIVVASTSDSGQKGAGNSVGSSLSADGTKVAFHSAATNLDPGDTDATLDIYVKDLTTGDITLASTSDTGVKGNSQSFTPSLSDDGTKVAFVSSSTNLVSGAAGGVYVKDLTTGTITLASTSDAGVSGNSGANEPSLSADGNKVAFLSGATNLDPGDTDSLADVYVKDLTTGNITLASTSDTGVKANIRSLQPSLSDDGTRVAFWTQATNLDPADTDTNADVYVKDLTTGDITLASTSDTGAKGDRSSTGPSLSADGTKLALESEATNFGPGAATPGADVYVKDLTTGDITLAATSDAGAIGDRFSVDPSLSGDGTRVAFWTPATNLDPGDTREDYDVYVKDLASGDITLVSTSDNGVKSVGDTELQGPPSPSADGSRVAFSSEATNLDPADTDTDLDIYVKQLPATSTAIAISDCSNSQSGTAAVVELRSYGARPLGCPVSLGGRPGSDYPDQTPVLLGANPSLRIDWASGPDSFGVAKLKMGTTGTQWRAVLAIQASPGHDTPATNQYLPASGSGFTKTKLKGRIDWSALDSFDCAGGTADPISWLDLVNNGSFIVKNA